MVRNSRESGSGGNPDVLLPHSQPLDSLKLPEATPPKELTERPLAQSQVENIDVSGNWIALSAQYTFTPTQNPAGGYHIRVMNGHLLTLNSGEYTLETRGENGIGLIVANGPSGRSVCGHWEINQNGSPVITPIVGRLGTDSPISYPVFGSPIELTQRPLLTEKTTAKETGPSILGRTRPD